MFRIERDDFAANRIAVNDAYASVISKSIASTLASVSSGLPNNFSHRKPIVPAVSEASKIAIFEAFIRFGSPVKARFVTHVTQRAAAAEV